MGLIIDNRGVVLGGWLRANGPTIEDPAENNQFHVDFSIGVYYTEEEAAKHDEISTLKRFLKKTDYRAIKYAEGEYTEEEYAPYKKEREEARARINEIKKDFVEPTLTRQEIDAAEIVAMNSLTIQKEE